MAITRPRAWFALLSVVLGGHGVQAAPLGIDLLPGERANIVDLQGEAPVRVAVLGSAELDVSSVELESLHLAGANIVKDGQGRTHVLEDVNGDGLLDLIVQFAPRQLRLGTGDTMTVLTGRTASGEPLEGRDSVQSLQAMLEAAKPASATDEKLPPLQVELLTAADSGELAVLGSVDLDPRIVALGSVRVNGASIGKGQEGDVVAYRDVNGDGREDALFWPKAALAGTARFEAATKMGRMLVGGPAPAPSADEAPAGAPKSMYPFQISLPDTSPASPYPATIQVSGATGVVSRVRVTINGIIHTCFNDLDIMLVAPSGQSVVLMSDVGGCGGVANATYLTFDDNALETLSPGAVPTTPSTVRVANDEGGDVFAAPAPAPSGATRLAAFNGTEPNGAWKLYIVDDTAGATGVVQRGWSLDLVTMTEVCNPTPLTLPDSGPASAYPSSITVAGLPPQIAKVSVTLNGLHHNNPDDLDVLLVGPSGRQETLMSDAGGVTPAVNLQLTFDDDATGFVGDGAALTSETYHPANHEGIGDPFPAPAPANISHADLREYRGENPNGTWRLYVVDDTAGATAIPDLGPFVSGGVYRPQNYEAAADPFPAPAPAGPYASDLFPFHGTEASGYWSLYVVDDAGQDVGSIQRWCLEVLPLYPAGEATNLRWPDRTTLQWDGAPNASTYFVLRGTQAELGTLLAATPEGCLTAGLGSREQVAVGITSEPPPGAFFWYLVLPRSGGSSYFPTGNARIAGAETARVADPAGVCAVP